MPFDPDVFGPAPSSAPQIDSDVFGAPMAAPLEASAPAAPREKPSLKNLGNAEWDKIQNYSGRDAIGGAVRGLASIGSTLIRPFESAEENAQRRAKLDPGLAEIVGSNPDSMAYKTNKIVAEVGTTAPLGGAVAKGISMIPGAARTLPTLLPAIQSGGMAANGAKGAYGMANRVAGGSINGALTAGAVNPDEAGTGMLFGGAFPVVTKLGGAIGEKLGEFFRAKPINPTLAQTAKESIQEGYVIPPNMVAPSLKSQVIESISGKQATQQVASIRNAATTEKLVRQDLGIAPDIPLTKSTLENLRKTAGTAYAEVSALSPQAAADLEALKVARNEAQGWFNAYNRSQHPNDLKAAKALRDQADQLEIALEQHAAAAGKPELVPALRDARKEIAKTYTVERALNDASGTVDARVLGRLYEKGKPLSGGLQTAGKFASAFPTVAKSVPQMGSPASHNLKSFASAAAAAGGYASLGPFGLAAAAVPFVAPPVARSIMFSKGAQQGMLNPVTQPGLLSLGVDETLPLLYRSGGLLATSDR